MALKKVKKHEFIEENQKNQEGAMKSMNTFKNIITEEDTVSSEEVAIAEEKAQEETMVGNGSQFIEDNSFNNDEGSKDVDDFFKDDTIPKTRGIFAQNHNSDTQVGNTFSLDDLELDFKPKIAVEEGKYKFQVINVSVEKDVPNDYGVKDKITLQFRLYCVGDEGVVEHKLNQRYNISTHYKSFFFQAYKALTGKEPFGKTNIKKLLGIVGDCEVEHCVMGDGNLFPKIINISTKV